MKLGYDFTEHWNAYVDANITHFNSSYPGTVTSPLYDADQWITRGVVSAALENHYNKTSGSLSVYSNFGRHKIDDGTKKAKELQEQMQKETAGKSREEAEKIVQDKSAQMQVASSEAQSKLKASLETALAEISKEKNLSAVLVKEAVPSGGVDVTEEVIKKMK